MDDKYISRADIDKRLALSVNPSLLKKETLSRRIRHRGKAGIYLHIPFCVRKCNYCAFLSAPAAEEEREQYVHALITEIRLRRNEVPEADAIYFGGGTPSLLTPGQIDRLIDAVRTNFTVSADAEITLEANPATLNAENLQGYRSAGVNRLSLGIQSFDDRRLRFMGRIHTAEEAVRDYELARRLGYDNISIDLMFAIPGSTLEEEREDVRKAVRLAPEHISFYSLQLEEGTPFFAAFENGTLQEIPDETDREMYHSGCLCFEDAGYEQYEISNFARPGRRSRHNSKYWSMAPYAGLGLGASSYTNGYRIVNETNLRNYIELLCGKDGSQWSDLQWNDSQLQAERISPSPRLPQAEIHANSEYDEISEAVFTGLRRREGIRYADILGSEEAFWKYYEEALPEFGQFERDGYVIRTSEGIRLTRCGIDISNRIMALFV